MLVLLRPSYMSANVGRLDVKSHIFNYLDMRIFKEREISLPDPPCAHAHACMDCISFFHAPMQDGALLVRKWLKQALAAEKLTPSSRSKAGLGKMWPLLLCRVLVWPIVYDGLAIVSYLYYHGMYRLSLL